MAAMTWPPARSRAPIGRGGAGPGDAGAYNGGQAVDPPDKAGQDITLVDIPKLIGIPFFNATAQGTQEAAAELGNVTVINDGPTAGDIDKQIEFIDTYITQGVDGVLFAANDPVAIGPVLTKALESGIHVVGYDANSVPEAREWFINQAGFNAIAKTMVDIHGRRARRGRQCRHRHLDLHHAEPGALDRRDERLCG